MTRSEAIAEHIAKAILKNTRRRFSSLYADGLSEFEKEVIMANGSVVTSGMNANPQPRPAQLQDNHDNLSLGERLGSAEHTQPKVSPNQNGQPFTPPTDNAGMSTDSTDGGPFVVKRDTYTQLVGKGAGPSSYKGQGDVVAASLAKAVDNGGPRKDAGQARLTSKLDVPATQTTVDSTEVGG